MCTAWLFLQGSRPLCSQILLGQGRPPSTILGIRKLDTGLPGGEDRIALRSLVFDTIPEYDGQTDGFAIAYTALAKLGFATL